MGNLIGVDAFGNANLDVAKRNKLANTGAGIYIFSSGKNQVKGGNVISGNGGPGVHILAWADDNRVDGSIIGLNRRGSISVPNGQGNPEKDIGVCVEWVDPKVPEAPRGTIIANNRIYARRCGVWFGGRENRGVPGGTQVMGNEIEGGSKPLGVGVYLYQHAAYLADNKITRWDIGVHLLGSFAYVGLKSCNFSGNDRHVVFEQGAWGLLGRDGATEADWRYGHNVFGDSKSYAVDAYGMHPNKSIYARNCNWGVNEYWKIEARIRFREGDTNRNSVKYDPALDAGASALPAAGLVVSSLTAQSTAQGAAITFTLSAEAVVSVQITNLAGRPVRTLATYSPCPAGANTFIWNGLSDHGTPVPSGMYFATVKARGVDGGQASSLAPFEMRR